MQRPNRSVLWYKQSSTQLLDMSFKLCNSLRHGEIKRLKQQKKKYIPTWHQEKENWWLRFVEGEGMLCLLCKKHAIKTVQNKESAFTQTASMRLKYDALKVHRDSDRHCKVVSQ